MEKQKTIASEINLSGTGVHGGKHANLRLKPAEIDKGINFIRVDLPARPVISARIFNVIDSDKRNRRTSIASNNAEVHTIEHLMASLAGLEIDNITIEIDSNEVPCFDGSAALFIDALKKAGIKEQDSPRKYLRVKEPIFVQEEDAEIIILPAAHLTISYLLSYDHPLLRAQYIDLELNPSSFEKTLGRARTYCLESEAKALVERGLGKGADYENTLVLGKKGIIKNKLRFEDECCRHKMLDLMGDIYLLGRPLSGHIIAIKSGHSLNIKFLKKIKHYQERIKGAGMGVSEADLPGKGQLDINDIKQILPHRYPFLLVDKIVEMEDGKRIVGIKNVTAGEQFFIGHFPGRPVMPGVLVIEAMAQTAGVLMLSRKENRGKLAYFMSINNVKFRRVVMPGDQLRLEVEVTRLKRRTGQVHTQALVNGRVVCEADLMFSLVDI